MAPFDRSHTSSYSSSIATMAVSVSFARYSDLLVENREIFIPHMYRVFNNDFTPSTAETSKTLAKLLLYYNIAGEEYIKIKQNRALCDQFLKFCMVIGI